MNYITNVRSTDAKEINPYPSVDENRKDIKNDVITAEGHSGIQKLHVAPVFMAFLFIFSFLSFLVLFLVWFRTVES